MLKGRVIGIIAVLSTTFLGCSKENLVDEGNVVDTQIQFAVDKIEGLTQSRASIFEGNSSIIDESIGGGNFTVQAYVDGTNSKYIDARVWYFADATQWRFRQGNDIYHAYWLKNNDLNFFTYMPWDLSVAGTDYVTINNYSDLAGPSFTCNIPQTSTDSEVVNEFIYGFRKGQSKATQDRDPDKVTRIKFVHPLAAVYLRLKQSHRDLKIHSITFKNAYNSGTYTNSKDTYLNDFIHSSWVVNSSGTRDRIISVEKMVPDDINFDAEIGGPYLVMPQSLVGETSVDDISIDINFSWDEYDHHTESVKLITANPSITEWLPGYKYTYTLDLGDNKEEILFKVMVEAWELIDYPNEIVVD